MDTELKQTGCLQENIEPAAVIAFLDKLKEKKIEIHSMVMLRGGNVAMRAEWKPYCSTTPHVCNSVTKTFIGIAIGMLYDRGLVHLEDKLVDYFPEIPIHPDNAAIREVTLFNLLTMSMGQDYIPAIDNQRDWVKALLNNPISFKPGSKFRYENLTTFLLSAIFKRVSGVKVSAYLHEHLFRPLGIEEAYFLDNHDDITIGGLGLFIPTEGLAKTGMMLVNKGVFNGKRILSEEWATMTLAKQINNADQYDPAKTESRAGYGFQCWHCTHGGVRMSGLWAQICLMLPEKNTVLAIHARGTSSQPILDLLWPTLYEGILEEGKTPAGTAEDEEKLARYLRELAIPPLSGGEDGSLRRLVSGKTVTFESNIYGLESMRLDFEEKGLKLVVKRDGTDYTGIFGNNRYVTAENNLYRMFPPYYDWLAPKLPDYFKEPKGFGSFTWLDDATLLLSMRYDNEATDYRVRLHFDYECLTFEWMPVTIHARIDHFIVNGRYAEIK